MPYEECSTMGLVMRAPANPRWTPSVRSCEGETIWHFHRPPPMMSRRMRTIGETRTIGDSLRVPPVENRRPY